MSAEHSSGAEPDSSPVGVSWGSGEDEETGVDLDPVLLWAPSGRRLLSGLLGLNIVLLGAALVAGQAFNPQGLRHQEPLVFLLVLMSLSVAWMLWYLLWARRQPGISPHTDHHAGGIAVTVVLMLFAAFSLLLHVFRMGYVIIMVECKPLAKVIFPFIEAPFLALQTYLLWAHSKDCIHKHKVQTRSGLILTLSADLLLWLNAVTEDTVHQEIELEKEVSLSNSSLPESAEDSDLSNATLCQCSASAACLAFRKGYEVLYPFNIEYYLMAGCLLYVMWKNVGRPAGGVSHGGHARRVTLRIVHRGGVLLGPVAGLLTLLVGVAIFALYQVWVGTPRHRTTAFVAFYGYHLAVVPVMSLCSLAGMVVQRMERREHDGGHNPTRSLDVLLLVGAALGQLSLSYFSLVAALAVGPSGLLPSLDLSYSLLSLLELVLQNIFIIEGLHRHPSRERGARSSTLEARHLCLQKNTMEVVDGPAGGSLLRKNKVSTSPSVDGKTDDKSSRAKRVTQEICAFLILANIMLWVIPAFGVHPQFENGLGKEFYGFTAWFILVNLGQPLGVFYRMHSVGALMELLITA
ncbi:proton channel OTOP3-like [Megalops cyprinoides]|uniref:proton channel OTOP3-like n=1 Tax=Megalops cyprinoides TaxID=118141 RepID=UPI0018648822|nr:proton channel OTOP3-like [Megalops cyprinoides]